MGVAGRLVSRPLLAAALVSFAAGCVMPDDMSRLQKDVADMRQDLARAAREQDDAKKRIAALEQQVSSADPVKRSEFADLRTRVDDNGRKIDALGDRIDQSDRRVDRLAQDAEASREVARRGAAGTGDAAVAAGVVAGAAAGGTVPSSPAGGTAVPNPDALYNAAYADFSKGNFPMAISGFEEYASRFPESPLADNAMYWVGECGFSQGNFAAALEAYDRMLSKYPKSEKAAAANLKKGLAYLEQNKIREATVQFRYVESTFPGSDEAKIAKERLAGLGKADGNR